MLKLTLKSTATLKIFLQIKTNEIGNGFQQLGRFFTKERSKKVGWGVRKKCLKNIKKKTNSDNDEPSASQPTAYSVYVLSGISNPL